MILLCGTGKGIGSELHSCLTRNGEVVASISRSEARTTSLREGLHCRADVKDVEVWSPFLQSMSSEITHFIYIAGTVNPEGRFLDLEISAIRETFEVNFWGYVSLVQQIFPKMKRGKASKIIYVGSRAGAHPYSGWMPYCTSKAAAQMFTQILEVESESDGLKFINVNPGSVATDMQKGIRKNRVNHVGKKAWSAHKDPRDVAAEIARLMFLDNDLFDDSMLKIEC